MCYAQEHVIFHIADYVYDFCPLPDQEVALSVFVCDVEHMSFHFGQSGCKFVLCFFVECPCLCTIMSKLAAPWR